MEPPLPPPHRPWVCDDIYRSEPSVKIRDIGVGLDFLSEEGSVLHYLQYKSCRAAIVVST